VSPPSWELKMRLQRTVVGGSQILNSNKTSKILDLYKAKKKKKKERKGKETHQFYFLFISSSHPLQVFFSSITKRKKGLGFLNQKVWHKKMAKSKQTYEEIRQKRVEENKKRMEELNLTKLSQSLLSKPSPVRTFFS